MLRFVLPTGSLADPVRSYLKIAGYDFRQPDRRGCCGVAHGVEFWQLDRRSIPWFLQTGNYDAGITGRDLLIASGVQGLEVICSLQFSRSSEQPTRWVLTKRANWQPDPDPDAVVRIGCELPSFAENMLAERHLPFPFRVVQIHGSEEMCVREGIVDLALIVTETGSSIAANGLEVVPDFESLFESTPVIVINPICSSNHPDLRALTAALQSVVGAAQRRMIVFDLPRSVNLQSLQLPAVVSPTKNSLVDDAWCAYTINIAIEQLGMVLVVLEDAGARGITVLNVQGYIA